jgi:carboxypeptidase family protein
MGVRVLKGARQAHVEKSIRRVPAGRRSVRVSQLRHVSLIGIIAAAATIASPLPSAAIDQRAAIAGTVTLTAADGQVLAAPGVRLTLICGTEAGSRTEVSDERGEFRFADVPVDTCSIATDLQGFATATADVETAAGEITALQFHLDAAPLFSGLTVTGEAPPNLRGPLHTSCGSGAPRRSLRSAGRTCGRSAQWQPNSFNASARNSRKPLDCGLR